eukprot:CAMPEP_0197850102 /NCGR_PEP_ID=MMETSP1438-20131217/14235_1 /TAXON_ID=1461541 /ORGANISM="Pterosperma sp., Strain CCMP1384" /LENGTH=331 /DNA_ID=CAMNT_0043463081 /DNA_START=233 /DNA_END=1225 /DNA_ORIENTATION=-
MSTQVPAQLTFTKEQLLDSPSRRDGICFEEEKKRRQGALRLLQAGGQLLSLPQPAILTAAVLLQRFYAVRSFRHYNRPQRIVTACLLLATKLEEAPRRISDILNLMRSLQSPLENLAIPKPITSLIGELSLEPSKQADAAMVDEQGEASAGPGAAADGERAQGEASTSGGSKGWSVEEDGGKGVLVDSRYYTAKEELLEYEAAVLKAMQFDVFVLHPHKYLLNYSRALNCSQPVIQLAFGMVNDCVMEGTLCLEYSPALLAAAALNFAILLLDVAQQMPYGWWEALGYTMELLDEVGHDLVDLYTELEFERGHVLESRLMSTGEIRRSAVW